MFSAYLLIPSRLADIQVPGPWAQRFCFHRLGWGLVCCCSVDHVVGSTDATHLHPCLGCGSTALWGARLHRLHSLLPSLRAASTMPRHCARHWGGTCEEGCPHSCSREEEAQRIELRTSFLLESECMHMSDRNRQREGTPNRVMP